MTTTTNTNNLQDNQAPQSASSPPTLSVQLQGPAAGCASILLMMARLYMEIMEEYGQQMEVEYQTQEKAAFAAGDAAKQSAYDEFCSMLSQGIGEAVSGAFSVAAGAYSMRETSEMGRLKDTLDNAKTYRQACQDRLNNGPEAMLSEDNPLLTHEELQANREITTRRLGQMRDGNVEFAEKNANTETYEGRTDQQHIALGEEEDVRALKEQVDSKINDIEQQIAQQMHRTMNNPVSQVLDGAGKGLSGTATAVGSYFNIEKGEQNRSQALAQGVLQLAQSMVSNLSEQSSSYVQGALNLYQVLGNMTGARNN